MTARTRSATERPHVLIVTDDRDLSDFLGEGLVMSGLWTSVIASAIQTLEVFRLRTFDLAIVDVALSGLGGVELVRRLRSADKDGATRTDIPILMIAGAPGEITTEAVRDAGADGLLLPPLELDELAAGLTTIVDQWRAAHPDRPYADELAQRKEP
jgi:two-component system, OmpR family, phosphate regulon response regulator PhoB